MTVTVDLLCVGYGAGALGAAVLAARRNWSVMYVDALPAPRLPRASDRRQSPWTRALADRWGLDDLSPETRAYVKEMTVDLTAPDTAKATQRLSITKLERPAPPYRPSSGAVPPFHGARLRTWARQCLTEPTGLISSHVCLPGTFSARSISGQEIEVSDIVSLPRTGLGEADLHAWLLGHARAQRVQIIGGEALHELLFQDGHPAGGIIDGPAGKRVVWTRHGVVLGIGTSSAPHRSEHPGAQLPAGTRLCLISRSASRFSRLELIGDQDLPSPRLRTPARRNRPQSAIHHDQHAHSGVDISRPRRWQLSHRRATW